MTKNIKKKNKDLKNLKINNKKHKMLIIKSKMKTPNKNTSNKMILKYLT